MYAAHLNPGNALDGRRQLRERHVAASYNQTTIYSADAMECELAEIPSHRKSWSQTAQIRFLCVVDRDLLIGRLSGNSAWNVLNSREF